MAELTDDDILEAADRIVKPLDLDDDARNAIVLGIQRLVWPPSPYTFLHDEAHTSLEISAGGRAGTLTCPGGCARRWRVNQAPDRDVVYEALMQAHEEYRTGRIISEAPELPVTGHRRLSLDEMFHRVITIEVTDERVTG